LLDKINRLVDSLFDKSIPVEDFKKYLEIRKLGEKDRLLEMYDFYLDCPKCNGPLYLLPIKESKGKSNVYGYTCLWVCGNCLYEKYEKDPIEKVCDRSGLDVNKIVKIAGVVRLRLKMGVAGKPGAILREKSAEFKERMKKGIAPEKGVSVCPECGKEFYLVQINGKPFSVSNLKGYLSKWICGDCFYEQYNMETWEAIAKNKGMNLHKVTKSWEDLRIKFNDWDRENS